MVINENGRNFAREEVESAYRQISSFKNNTIDALDLPKVFNSIGYIYTAEKLEQYVRFWNVLFDGRIPLEDCVEILAVQNDTRKLMRACVKDKDGFIDEGEFKVCVEVLLVHDPAFPRVQFTKFVAEADTNKDGKVNIEEAVTWFSKQA